MIMGISWDEIGTDEALAREVLIVARDIAPCLDAFDDDTEPKKNAIAVIVRVYRDLESRGSMFVKSQSIGSASVSYVDVRSAFDGQPRRALRALCTAKSARGVARGSFPNERPISRLWPETY